MTKLIYGLQDYKGIKIGEWVMCKTCGSRMVPIERFHGLKMTVHEGEVGLKLPNNEGENRIISRNTE
jgi:hypothetical protein